ncbi:MULTISPECIES: response regulator [unclassified Chelatococcus]|jgi:two-component system OmpR family response regulator|uniref:response regulator n=1 Tax=unclassified Chelatococcus TaxID=2638111 RepID=UPI001BD0290D|nr:MULTISPECIES: response regulator [unclassified Chelatococcus]CAH1662381.1 DNA-binding transcriptional dual regulator OmpR [Hyphomicrobiales bacterium]MBS7741376.1 response regulator [Chelatococcus sp. HY11]MBX3546142.1 response regulator [Chelatococcus sp.]MCO5077209.1 response regulator [Chelatococcus sp.]CAH1682721.1 DNA-binding transcriptional dual regulator OmpR [Hyphomicrobiales bacterium]
MSATTAQPHVLIVDDDPQIRGMLVRFLSDHGMRTTEAANGERMFAALSAGRFDIIVLDIMMPGEDGLSLCRRLRAENPVPIVLLTAMNHDADRIVGLELGADDYVTKPFNPRELLARIRAILRRMQSAGQAAEAQGNGRGNFNFSGWRLDASHRTLHSPDGVLTDLTSGEFDLLLAFVEHPERVLSRDQLLDLAHGRVGQLFDRSIDVQVSRLRRKIEIDPQDPQLIKTVRSGGYIFTSAVARGDGP